MFHSFISKCYRLQIAGTIYIGYKLTQLVASKLRDFRWKFVNVLEFTI